MAFSFLVVDDSSLVRNFVKKALTASRIATDDLREAVHGAEALALLRERPAEVVLTDLNMPVLDGLSFIREIARLYQPLPYIVVISSEGSGEQVFNCLTAGARHCLKKPFSPRELREALKGVVNNGSH